MKKLMTTVSAVAVALGLYATDTGTSFEGLTAGAYDITASTGELTAQEAGSSYWVTNATSTLTVVDGTSINTENRPDRFVTSTQNQYLSIKTTLGSPVTRNVSVGGGATSIGTGFYFDSLVKFTAFEGDQTFDLNANGGKLAIWLKETLNASDEPTATNLVITAGFLAGDSVVVTNYDCVVDGVNLNDGGWHRVTVKAINSIYKSDTVPGFAVYIDGLYVSSTAEKGIVAASLTDNAKLLNVDGAIFPSAVQAGNDKTTIAAVQFDGQGDVDDLVFTATAPSFAVDREFFTIKVGENVASVNYEAYDSNGDSIQSGTITADELIPYENGMYVDITATAAAGYVISGISGQGVSEDAQEDNRYLPSAAGLFVEVSTAVAGANFNGKGYATLAEAAAAFNEITTAGAYVIELGANSTAGGVVFDNANTGVGAILDLKGFNITADSVNDSAAVLLVNGSLEITNSTATVGHIIGGDVPSVAATGGILWIADGICDGAVSADGATSFLITGGAFVKASNDGTLTTATLPEGYALVDGTGDFASYYVLGEAVLPVVVAEHPWYESPGAVVLAENLPEQTGNYVSAFHGQGSGNFLGLTYSTNPLQFDLFGVDGTNALTTIHTVAAGDVENPGFRGVAISETLGVAMTLAYATTTTMYTFPLAPVVGGNGQKAVTKPSDYAFDAAAFSPDGNYLFSNIVAGPEGNTHYVKWTVSADDNTGALALAKVGTKAAGGRGRSLAYARINGRDLVFGLVDTGKVVVMDMTDADPVNWTAADLVTGLGTHSYGTLCVSGVNVVDALGNAATPHLTVATANNNGATKGDVLNVYALTVPASGAVTASLDKSFDEDALTAAGFGDISDANRYGNTVYVTDDEATIYFARPDAKLYAGQFAYVVNFVVDGVTNSVPVFPGATVSQADPTKENYIFDGWFAPGAGQAYDLTTPVTQDLTLEARFTAAEAKIGTALYLTLQAAVDAAQADDTVTVLKDCTIATSLSIAKNITVHNDYTIAANVNYAICIGATVSFEGTGKIERASNISGSAFCVGANETTRGAITAGTAGTLNFDGLTVCGGNGGNLIKLENGTVNMNGGVLKDGLRGIKADADAGSYTSAIVINGGTITNCSAYAVFASAESANGKATITINGGEIAGPIGKAGKGDETITIPGTSTAKFDRDQSALCAPGYATALSDGWYVVGPASYTITYLNPDGTEFTNFIAGVQIKMTYDVTEDVDLPTAVHMNVVGVEFDGWTNATGQVYGWLAGTKTGNQTFYAKLDPVVPPVTVTYDAGSSTAFATEQEATIEASMINANRSTRITVPTGISDENGAYTGLFYAYASGNTVTIDFTEEAAGDQATNVTAVATKALPVATVAAAGANGTAEANLTGLTPGVYYSVVSRSTIAENVNEAWVESARVMADATGAATLVVPNKGNAGFYKVVANAADNSNSGNE